MGASGEMAVVRFAAFAAGVSVGEVSMVGGVHVLAGNKRTVVAEEERVVAQRDERGERRACLVAQRDERGEHGARLAGQVSERPTHTVQEAVL